MISLSERVTKLRIGTRLAGAFSILLALTLLMAAMAAQRLSRLASSYDLLAAEQYETSSRVDMARRSANVASRKLLVLIGLPRDARVSAYAQIDAANERLDMALSGLRQSRIGREQGEAVGVVLQRLHNYRQAYLETAELIEADDLERGRSMLGSRTEAALDGLSEALNDLTRQQHTLGMRQSMELQARIDLDRLLLWGLCAGALLLGALLALLVSRSIVRPLRRAEVVGHLLARGEYQHRIKVSGQDEVGRVSQAMNTLAEAVGEREQRLLTMAHTDALTDLAQRTRFLAESSDLLAGLGRRGGRAVLVCVDVDRLKTVNAVLGFDAGDAVLRDAALRLRGAFHEDARLARLGGGTFVALAPCDDVTGCDPAALAAGVRRALEDKVRWQGHVLDMSVSLGMALYPDHAADPESLLRRAEQAMFEGKRQRESQMVYNPSIEASRRSHLSLLSELQEAIAGGQLRQFLQPKLTPGGRTVKGAEALVRWQHPERGWLPPSEFIPFAESTGRIRQLTHWMLEQAVLTLARWHEQGLDLSVAVNVSTLDLQDGGLPDRVAGLLRRHGVPPHRLQLELTESGLLSSGPDPIRVLHAIRAIGVGLSVDDFGTGQSSLAYLQKLPVNELKIDRSFVDGVDGDPKRQALLRSIVDIGHSLALQVTAEGVETEAELAVIRGANCDLVQGYLLAKPMATEAFEGWLAQQAGATAVV